MIMHFVIRQNAIRIMMVSLSSLSQKPFEKKQVKFYVHDIFRISPIPTPSEMSKCLGGVFVIGPILSPHSRFQFF